MIYTMLDAALLILLGGFVLFGLWFGFIHTLGALIGTMAGAFIASRMFEPFAQWIYGLFGGDINFERIIAFLIIFLIVNRIVGFVFSIFEKTFSIFHIIPFLRSIDRLTGAILGFFEGAFVLGLTLFIIQRFPVGNLQEYIATSSVSQFLLGIAAVLVPLIPSALRVINERIDEASAFMY